MAQCFNPEEIGTNIKPNQKKNGDDSTISVITKNGKTVNNHFLIKKSYEEDLSWIPTTHLKKKKPGVVVFT